MTTAQPAARTGAPVGPAAVAAWLTGRLGPGWWRGPVAASLLLAAALHLLWATVLASAGGDIAAQDAWAQFAGSHPFTAYNLEWYGGIHTVSYSIISPYVMAWAGVRTTMVVCGTLTSGMVAWLVTRLVAPPVTHRSTQPSHQPAHQATHQSGAPARGARTMVPALFGTVALFGNAASGRVTFALGALLGVAGLCLLVLTLDRPDEPTRPRTALRIGVAVCGALATAASPVAGLFLGLIAAALWLCRRRVDALALGVPPTLVVGLSSLLFPFSGEEPMHWSSAILPFVVPLAVLLLAPREWRLVRTTAAVYCVAVLGAWLLPSPVGTNVVRMGLLFGGTVLVAVAVTRGWERSWWTAWWQVRHDHRQPQAVVLLAMALVTASLWQVGVATIDAVQSRPTVQTEAGLTALVSELRSRHAELGRIEVVPTRSHREAAALAPYVALARGWNRQADVGRNPLFYKRAVISPEAYHRWLKRWAVSYVVLGSAEPDPGARAEAAVVAAHPDYLRQVWTDGDWTLFAVTRTKPLVDAPASVTGYTSAVMTVQTPAAGDFTVRIPSSPWLALVDADGRPLPDDQATTGCLSALLDGKDPIDPTAGKNHPDWVVLHAPAPGTYRISAPYKLPRGSSCS